MQRKDQGHSNDAFMNMLRRKNTSREAYLELPACGVNGILAYFKLVIRAYEMIKTNPPGLKEAPHVLLCLKGMIVNIIYNKLEQLQHRQAKEVGRALTSTELALLYKLQYLTKPKARIELTFAYYIEANEIPEKTDFIDYFLPQICVNSSGGKTFISQLQSFLRQYILMIVEDSKILTNKFNSQDVKNMEPLLVQLDLLICFFQFNSVLIQDDDWVNFEKTTKITEIAEFPFSFNEELFEKFVLKIKELELVPQEKRKSL